MKKPLGCKVKVRKLEGVYLLLCSLLADRMDNVAPQNTVENLNKFSFSLYPSLYLMFHCFPGSGITNLKIEIKERL